VIKLIGKCYLFDTRGSVGGYHEKLKRDLLQRPGVYRITDHGTHLKVNTTKPLPAHWEAVLVKDQTTHWDATYWDFALAAFRHSVKRGHDSKKAVGVLIHYLCNLYGFYTTEAELLELLAAGRRWTDKTVTDEAAHGWELKALDGWKKDDWL
jgi:hypothetical protein